MFLSCVLPESKPQSQRESSLFSSSCMGILVALPVNNQYFKYNKTYLYMCENSQWIVEGVNVHAFLNKNHVKRMLLLLTDGRLTEN